MLDALAQCLLERPSYEHLRQFPPVLGAAEGIGRRGGALVGTLGGLFLFGPIGFIVGPMVCGLFLTVWDIYGTTFKDILPPVKSLRTGATKPAPTLRPGK